MERLDDELQILSRKLNYKPYKTDKDPVTLPKMDRQRVAGTVPRAKGSLVFGEQINASVSSTASKFTFQGRRAEESDINPQPVGRKRTIGDVYDVNSLDNYTRAQLELFYEKFFPTSTAKGKKIETLKRELRGVKTRK